ncbi:RNA methyltransferase [Bowdeniella nasicola]|uniref:RNA methyltransferase n=1 Tax=Bowdeniella nasicola TaxID=208480 RepID=A0A1Q5Q0I2_9ACTO|nr:TrmH family RNA methyltransferase [Bowdeniella nasicola]OKL53374.1 RNA methyltransferase [Bowdeniella nasicola]
MAVGPWPGGPDAWPTDQRFDPELLEHGDRRNVEDHYRYWTMDAIIADIDQRRRPLHIAIENLDHDFNIGSIVRTANAFAVARVHIVGRRRWNRRGAMVTDRYQHVDHHETVAGFDDYLAAEGISPIGIDNVENSVPIEGATLPEKAVLIFGSEARGLSSEMREICPVIHHITQFGSTRSINVGHAAAIAMWAWSIQHAVNAPDT